MKNFVANTEIAKQEMLDSIGISSIDELYDMVPEAARMKELNLPDAISEMETQSVIRDIANKNKTDYACFIGGGAYRRFIPAAVNQISSRFEFNTAYTPYQPEISQGTLQVIYEFQSMICDLTGMDVSNASVYDAGNACAEAILMASRITGKSKFLISNALNPEYIEVVKTYAKASDIELVFAESKDYKTDLNEVQALLKTGEYGAILLQVPNYFGSIEDLEALKDLERDSKTLLIACVEGISLAALKKPSYYGADIVVGDVQSFGNPVSFGGPYAGFVATTDKHKRQLAGRIVGRTVDADGNQAFTLTLQAREQHIRREKATSNICSNQALIALNATVYLALMGKTGIREVAYLSSKNAHTLAEGLLAKGYKVLNKEYFNEFVLEVPDADTFISKMKEKGILAGIKLDETKVIVATTELNTKSQIEKYIQSA